MEPPVPGLASSTVAGAAYGAISSIGRSNNALLRQYGRTWSRTGLARADRNRLEHPCHWLCLDCGHLVPQTTTVITYRRNAEDDPAQRPGRCLACGGVDHADLRQESVLEALLEREADSARRRIRLQRRLRVVLLPLALLFGLLVDPLRGPWVMGVLYFVFRLHRVRLRLPRAARWSLPELEGHPQARHRGRVQPVAAPIVAPLTGRPCLAYEIRVCEADQPRDPDWLLHEQHAVDLRVGEHEVRGDELRVWLPREQVEVDDGKLVAFLRRRGLVRPVDQRWVVLESILPADAEVELVRFSNHGAALARLATEPALREPDPQLRLAPSLR